MRTFSLLALPALAAACAAADAPPPAEAGMVAASAPAPPSTPPPPVPPPPPDSAAYISGPEPVLESTGDPLVDRWRARVFEEGGPAWRPYLLRAFAGVGANPAILSAAPAEPESAEAYVERYLTPARVAEGRRLYAELAGKPLFQGEQKVPTEVLLALWGVMSDYGRSPPPFDMIQALAMRGAYNPQAYPEKFDIYYTLRILAEGRAPRSLAKAYADGRIGQVRYIPENYLEWGEDGDGDGQVNVWTDREDILRNLQRLLTAWQPGIPLIVEVDRPNWDRSDPRQARIADGIERGGQVLATYYRRADGRPWPAGTNWGGELIEPFGPEGPAFLTTYNYTPINFASPFRERYGPLDNHNFALTVGLLAEAIAGRPGTVRPIR